MRTIWKWFIPFMFGLFLLPLAAIFPSEIALENKFAALRAHGVEAAAQVDREDERTTKGRTIYIAAYHFHVDQSSGVSASSFSGDGRMSANEYVHIQIGGKIPIIYDARDPAQSMTKTQLNYGGALPFRLLIILMTLFIGIPAAMTGFMFFMYCREKQLLQRGSVVPARVVSEEEYSQRGGRFSKVTYEFKDGSGATITGIRKGAPTATDTRARFVEYRARIYDNPTAIFDPQNSRRNMMYPPSIANLL